MKTNNYRIYDLIWSEIEEHLAAVPLEETVNIIQKVCSFLENVHREIDPRCLSKFSAFCVDESSRNSMFQIFSTILESSAVRFRSVLPELKKILIDSTLNIFEEIRRVFVVTPLKFHYVFSLRDLKRVFQGFLRAESSRLEQTNGFLRLWINEIYRVFSDRLTEEKDRIVFERILSENLSWSDEKTFLLRKPLIFSDFRAFLHDDQPKVYEDFNDFRSLKEILTKIIDRTEIESVSFKSIFRLKKGCSQLVLFCSVKVQRRMTRFPIT